MAKADQTFLAKSLARTPLFAHLQSADLDEIVRQARSQAVQRAKIVTPQKGKSDEVYLVTSGALAEVQPDVAEGKSVLVALYGPGDVAGLDRVFAPKDQKRSGHAASSFRTLTNASLVAIPCADFRRIVARSPEFAEAAFGALAEILAALRAQHASALHSPLEIRLARFFARLADLAAGDDWQPTANVGRMPQAAIADMLGVTREHINRTLTMWERSGLIFQAKSGDIIVENRKRLIGLAAQRHATPAAGEGDWLWEIDAHLDVGLNDEAYDLAMEAAKRSPKDKRFKHRAVLATARGGASHEALNMIETFGLSEDYSDEELACLRPRLMRDIAYAGKAEPHKKPLSIAAAEYLKAFKGSRGAYSGVNAAALHAILGEHETAQAIATEVSKITEKAIADLDEDEIPYWSRSTLGETYLVAGRIEEAATQFRAANNAHDMTPGKKAQTRRQLRRLSAQLSIDQTWIDAQLPQPSILYFCGPMATKDADASSQPLARVASAIEDFLQKNDIEAAYGALAAGADVVIAEAVLEAGASLHVVLPLAPEDFLKSSIDPFGGAWRERFIACLRRASSIDWGRRTSPGGGAFELGAIFAMGRTIRHAEDMEADAVGFFAARNATVDGSISHRNLDLWRALGLSHVDCVDDWPAPDEPAFKTADDEIVFALTYRPKGKGARLSPPGEPRVIISKTQNGLTFLGYATPAEALEAASAVREKLGERAHYWLDAGVAPLSGSDDEDVIGRFLTAACRPTTEAGKIYASEVFTNVAVASGAPSQRFDYIGYTGVEEKLEPCPLFLVTD